MAEAGQLPNYALPPNPMLPVHPLKGYTDSIYEASHAQLQRDIQNRYGDIIQQLGYEDPTTHRFIKGLVEINADRQRDEYGNQLGLARTGVDQQSQRDQNYFSGYRADQIAKAEHPIVQALANMDVDIPQQLSSLYEKAGGLLGEYNTSNDLLLAQAAGRYNPAEVGGGGADEGGGGDTGAGGTDGQTFTPDPLGYAPGGVTYDPIPADQRVGAGGGKYVEQDNLRRGMPKLPIAPPKGYAPGGVEYARPKPPKLTPLHKFTASRGGYAGGGVAYRGVR